MTLSITSHVGQGIVPFIPDLARLRMSVFAEWPYLYAGSLSYEETYLRTYASSPESLVVVCRDGERVVGASTAIPLRDEEATIKAPIAAAGLDPDGMFYFGESVLLPEYRGRGVGARFFAERERHARSFPWCTELCFAAVVRPERHPSRPPSYRPLDAFWLKQGFRPVPGLFVSITWQEHGEVEATAKKLQVWRKPLET